MTNSIRYSPDNSQVFLKVDFLWEEGEFGFYHFSVSDQGAGISDSQLGTIFNYKESSYSDIENDDNLKGMGIGLYVVSNYLKAMDSQIKVRSTKGVGSEFYFDLRIKMAGISKSKINSIDFSRKYKILVVDDHNINLIVAKKAVQSLGLHCITAKDTDPILEIMAEEKIDLILMDLNMPLINGFDLSRKIRDSGYTMPIIAHTAVLQEHLDPDALLAADIQGFILKPYEMDQLRDKLILYLET